MDLKSQENHREILLSQSQICPVNQNLKKHEKLKRLNIIQKILIYLAISLFVTLLILLNFYFKHLYYQIYLISKHAIEGDFWTMIGITFFFAMLFQMLFVPGISFYLIYLGFITKSFLKSFLLIYPFTLVIVILTYFISKFTLRDWLKKGFESNFIKNKMLGIIKHFKKNL